MTGWYIAGGVLAFFLLVLLLPIRVHAAYREELSLKVGYAFFSFRLLPQKEEKKKPPAPKKKKAAKKPSKKASPKKQKPPSQVQELKKKAKEILHYQGLSGLLELLKDVGSIAAGAGKKLFAHFTLKKFDLLLTVGGEDAAETALSYGKLCGVVYPAVGSIVTACKCRKYGVTVQPDFDASETQAELEARGQIRLVFVLAYSIQALFRFIMRVVRLNRELEAAKEKEHHENQPRQ